MRVDWPALIERLATAGITRYELANRLQISERNVRYWRDALTQPTHYTGERVIAIYCEAIGCERDGVPIVDGKTFPPR